MPCKYNDEGWCYAPKGVEANEVDGSCFDMKRCPQATPWDWDDVINDPPKLLKFQDSGDDSEEHW